MDLFLDAHDRAAELSVVNGTWDWLADEPEAAAVRPWLEAAVIGRLPREQRADALANVRLRTKTWPIAIGRPILPRDNLLVAAWLRHQGLDGRLAALVRNAVVALRNAATEELTRGAALLVGGAAEMSEAIGRLATDPGLRAELSLAGRRSAVRYSWDASARAHERAYTLACR